MVKTKNYKLKTEKGFSLLEGLVALGILTVIGGIVVGGIVYSQITNIRAINTSRAIGLASEAIEAAKDIRTADFFALADGIYGLDVSGGKNQLLIDNPDVTEIFSREIKITSVGFDTKQVEATVSWPADTSVSGRKAVRLITEFRNWLPTVEDWSSPTYDGDFDLTPENSGSNNHKVRAVNATGNYLFVGNDNSAGKEFLIFDLTHAPTLKIKGTLDLTGNPNDMAIYNNYAFIASSDNFQELQVVNFNSIASPSLAAYLNISGNSDALSAGVNGSGTILVLGMAGGSVYVFNITAPTNPTLVGQISLSGSPDVNDLKIYGNNVFIAAGDGTIRIIDVSNPNLPAQISSLALSGCAGARTLDITLTRLYAGCSGSKDNNELFIASIENPAAPLLLSSANVGDQNTHIYHVSFASNFNLVFLLTGNTASDFQVWDASNDLMPSLFSQADLTGFPSQAIYSPLVQKMFVGLISNPEIQVIAPDLIYD